MKLQIGTKVKIINDESGFPFSFNKIKEITKILANFQDKNAYELDNEVGIWLEEDFQEIISEPKADFGLFNVLGERLNLNEVIELLPDLINLKNVTRVEVIDSLGRSYTNWNKKNKVIISFQDNQQTLKVFIK